MEGLTRRDPDGDLWAFDPRRQRWVQVPTVPRRASWSWAIFKTIAFLVFALYITTHYR